jgi:TonB-linked SusC/RagA family outer membrane protein
VLKDASAAAVYGSRSGNGVILIETKKGKSAFGKPQVDVNLNVGTSNQMKPLEVYDSKGYIQRLLDIREARGVEADPTKVEFYLQTEEAKNYMATPDHQPTLTDPFSLFRQQGQLINANFSLANRTEKTRYYLSGNVINQQGVVRNDEFSRFTGRMNIETDLSKWLTVGIKTNYSFRNYPNGRIYGAANDGSSMYAFSPYASIHNEDGSYRQFPQTTTSFNSPYWQIATTSVNQNNSLNGIGTILVKVPGVKGLTYTMNASITQNWNENYSFYNSQSVVGLPKKGSANRTYNRSTSQLLDNIIKYNRTFASVHNVDLTLLYSYENYRYESISASGSGFDNESLGSYGLGTAAIQSSSSGGGESVGKGAMGRLTYTFNNKYSLTGTIRKDGYSAFGANNKWASFPSVGVNWNISKEEFMERVSVVSNLAVRASYGSNGTRAVNPYQTLARMSGGRYIYANDPSYTYTQSVSSLGNEDLAWESTSGYNLGIDFGFLKNRIMGSLDLYSKHTENLIFPQPLPSIGGISSITSNLGRIGNKGVELGLTTVNVNKGKFRWTSDLAFSLNRNKVESIYGQDKDGDGKEDDLVSSGYFIGRSLGTIYGYRITGMWQQTDKDAGTIMTGMAPGTYKLQDVDADGKITSDKDRQFLGNGRENFRWSLTNTFDYKNWSMMLFVNSIWGGNGYFLAANSPYLDPYAEAESLNRPTYDYWTPKNPNATFPRLNNSTAAVYKGTKYMDRSFVRLQKASLTYNLSSMVSKYGIKGLRASL